jgi:uncharacterized membrane protein
MNSSSNPSNPSTIAPNATAQEATPATEPAQKAGAPSSAFEASSKLIEAQGKILEAEAQLMPANASSRVNPAASSGTGRGPQQPVPPPQARSAGARPDANPSRRGTAGEGQPTPGTIDTRAKAERGESGTEEAPPNRARDDGKDASAGGRVEAKKASAEAKAHTPSKPLTENVPENVAGMLCYLFGWASGLVFLFLDRRPSVRFHAAQSVAIFATLSILILALSGFFLGAMIPSMAGALLILRRVLELGWLVAAVVLILRAAGGERYRVKIASEYGDRAAHGAK